MTALEALIQHCERPTPTYDQCLGTGDRFYLSFLEEIAKERFEDCCPDDEFTVFFDRVTESVQANQRAAGIPVRTIQEAIDAGETV